MQALATPETFPNGRLLDYPADWGSRAATIAADNNMQLTAVPAGSEGALVAELESAAAAKKPLLMMFWAPHYALASVDVDWVKLPPCKTQENEHCINPPEVHKVLWKDFDGKWPAAYAFLQKFEMDASRAAEDDAGDRQERRGYRRRDQGLDRREPGDLGAVDQGRRLLIGRPIANMRAKLDAVPRLERRRAVLEPLQ